LFKYLQVKENQDNLKRKGDIASSWKVIKTDVGQQESPPCLCTDKNEKEEFFSEEFFTINKETFPYYQGKIFLHYP
jgi:hypothetical protein